MSPTVSGKNLVVEMFDTETKAGHADVFQCFQFRLLQRAGLTFGRQFSRDLPRHVLVQPVDETVRVSFADVRRCGPTEVCKGEQLALKGRRTTVEFVLLN